ncbi:MAG: galactokinase [Chloroflexi bacterium]|nr:galactokinase [Chloroflexota bacterium]
MGDEAVLQQRLLEAFHRVFGPGQPPRLFRAPGRVNLIGEHTDYNDGWVLPVAIQRYVWAAARPHPDGTLALHSLQYGQTVHLPLHALHPCPETPWANYPAGVAWAYSRAGLALVGAQLALGGDVPVGAGLASSAALETTSAVALEGAAGLALPPQQRALLCQQAEREFVGVQCGIMDQYISAAAQAGHALCLDCRTLDHVSVPLPAAVRVVIADTGVRRTLAASAYNERRAQCQEGVRLLRRWLPGIAALRDVSPQALARWGKTLPATVRRRCTHVVHENGRVLEMVRALETGDLQWAGRLMNASHASLRDLYDVSGPELDVMVEIAQGLPGCFGSRLTGAGFGGCTVSLVQAEQAHAFAEGLARVYQARLGRSAEVFIQQPAAGAGEVAP